MTSYVLYNPLAGGGTGEVNAQKLKELWKDKDLHFLDMTAIRSYEEFLKTLSPEYEIILCGGDGTLNRFLNETENLNITNEIYYYAAGSGNDFWHDLKKAPGDPPARINEYLKSLPSVTVKGEQSRVLNGVGYGIDGYCCEVGDKLRRESTKPVNYTGIAIKGLLFHYHPTGATVIVDGTSYRFEKVWLAPTMNGHYYGGGMMPTPGQDRLNPDGTVSVMVMHGSGKLRTLMIFPSIFKGEHVKHEKYVSVLSGHDITVAFDEPRPLQIDGETILDVTNYHVTGRQLS